MTGHNRRGFLAGAAAGGLAAVLPGGRVWAQAAPRRIEMRPATRYRIEGEQAHSLAETVFEVPPDYSGEAVGLEIGPAAQVDALRIRVAAGARNIERFLQIGPGVRIGLLDVAAEAQSSTLDDKLDGFVQIRADGVRIEEMRFVNVDYCLMVHRAADVAIGRIACTSYCRGVRLDQSRDVRIGALQTRVMSPNGRPNPGQNGLTISDCTRVDLPLIEIEDSAEHGIYLAGGGKNYRSEAVRFGQVTVRRPGQCGLKCKSTGNGSVDITVDVLRVADAAFGSKPGRNEDALRVEKATGFRIGRLEAWAEASRAACHAGVFLDGVTDFVLGSGAIERPAGPLVLIEDKRGPNTGITITGLDGRDLGSHGYHLAHSHGEPLSGLAVDGGTLHGVGGDAVRIDGAPGPGGNHIRIGVRGVRGALVAGEIGGVETQVTPL